jgi:hypothetical protein
MQQRGVLVIPLPNKATTQSSVRMVANLTFEQRGSTGALPIQYQWLHHKLFHDTMKANDKPLRGKKYCEIYATDFGWSRAFLLKEESALFMIPWINSWGDTVSQKRLYLTMPRHTLAVI